MKLTVEQAKQVKYWRVTQDMSWRQISNLASRMWFNTKIKPDNQMHGIELCDEAMAMLNETVEDGWD